MELNKRLQEAERDARAEAKKSCSDRGRHQWDYRFGRTVSGGGEQIDVGYCGGPDIPDPVYSEYWSHLQRKCVDCGEIEVSHAQGYDWKYEAGLGEIRCDPKTGRRYWWDKKKRESKWIYFDK